MLITLLAAAMMIAMLIATAFALHEEGQRRKSEIRAEARNPFRPGRN